METHICPVKSRGGPLPEGSPQDLHSAGLYDSETAGSTRTYLEESTEMDLDELWNKQQLAKKHESSRGERKLADKQKIRAKRQPWGKPADGWRSSPQGRDHDDRQ